MLNRSASLAMSTCVLKALPGKLDIKRHSPSILYIHCIVQIYWHLHIYVKGVKCHILGKELLASPKKRLGTKQVVALMPSVIQPQSQQSNVT